MAHTFAAPDLSQDLFLSSCRSAGISRMIELPTISAAEYPRIFSAPVFQLVMNAVQVFAIMRRPRIRQSPPAAPWLTLTFRAR